MKKKAIIFDMDGVLVDSENAYLDLFRDFLAKHQKEIKEDILLKIVGADTRMTWNYMSMLWGPQDPPEYIRQLFHSEYPDEAVDYRDYLFPGIPDLLDQLKAQGYTLALASSSKKKAIHRMLKENELECYFNIIVSGEDFKESKPNPEIYHDTRAKLQLAPEECLIVEDSSYGIQAGKAAGMEVVAIKDTQFSFDQSAADYFIDKTTDLINLLPLIEA